MAISWSGRLLLTPAGLGQTRYLQGIEQTFFDQPEQDLHAEPRVESVTSAPRGKESSI